MKCCQRILCDVMKTLLKSERRAAAHAPVLESLTYKLVPVQMLNKLVRR